MQHVWIFQLAQAPSETAKSAILKDLDAFMVSWKAHGSPVPGVAELRYDRFVIVVAEPGHASGCSIDAMTKGVGQILSNQGIEVLGPEYVMYKDASGNISKMDFKAVRAAVLDGTLSAQSIVFDSTMGQSNDLARWELPLEQTWMGRFLPQKA